MATTSTKKRQEIGERLRHERERLGYTKQQIAQLLGVPIPAYERFENGDDDPGVYRLPRLAACGFDVMFIITGPWLRKTNFSRAFATSRSAAARPSSPPWTHSKGWRRTSSRNSAAASRTERLPPLQGGIFRFIAIVFYLFC